MAPVFGRLAKAFQGRIEFVAVNVYDRPDIARRFGVATTPTFILARKGKALRHFYGNIREPLLKRYLAPYAPQRPTETDAAPGGGLAARIFRRLRGRHHEADE